MRDMVKLLKKLGLEAVLEKFDKYVSELRNDFGDDAFGKESNVDVMKEVIIALAERKPYAIALPGQLRVYNSFPVKDELKKLGYSFDGFWRMWYKKVEELRENRNYLLIHVRKIDEVEKLRKLGIPVMTYADQKHLEAFTAKVEEGVL